MRRHLLRRRNVISTRFLGLPPAEEAAADKQEQDQAADTGDGADDGDLVLREPRDCIRIRVSGVRCAG